MFVPRVNFKWLWFDLFVDYFDASYEGSGNANLNFAGTPISGPVQSELDWAQARALATFDLVPTDMVDIGIGLGVSYIDFQSRFTSGGNTEELEGSAPLPYPAAKASVEFWRIEVGGTAGWIEFNADDVEARYLEADVYARLKLIGGGLVWGGLVLGYRLVDTDIDFEDDGDFGRVDLEFSGPYAGLTVAF